MTDTATGHELFAELKDGLDLDDDVVQAALHRVFEQLGPEKSFRLIVLGILELEDVGVALGKDEQTLRNWVARRQIPYVTLGNRNVYLVSSIRAWLREKEVKPRGRH